MPKSKKTEETAVNSEIEELQKLLDEEKDKLLRIAAEYDNFKKRTEKEKTMIYEDAVCRVVSTILPVIDNLERAVDASGDFESLKQGVDMVLAQTLESFEKLSVTAIEAVGQEFDPNMHNAVMHIEDDSGEVGVVCEEFQKGYKVKDKVIRHSMVKVKN